MSVKFRNPYFSAPPGGFSYTAGGETVTGRCYMETLPKVQALMDKHGVEGLASEALPEQMCPKLGPLASAFCEGDISEDNSVRSKEAYENSLPYTEKPLTTFDKIEARLARCLTCPKHSRDWCLTCTGHYDRLMTAFRGARPPLPVDRGTGVCNCARAYEFALCSVDYQPTEFTWEGTPDTCWRKSDV